MAQRKAWTTYEDSALKTLKQTRKIQKWSLIATILENQFGVTDRNGKQCRERYHNHLDIQICNVEWSHEEDQRLVSLHNQMGNKWASIARSLPGRTDNCVKNRLYSLLRKGLRIINGLREETHGIKLQPLKPSFIYTIIKKIEKPQKKNEGTQEQQRFVNAARRLKEEFLKLSVGSQRLFDEIEVQNIENLLHIFSIKNDSPFKKSRHSEHSISKASNFKVLKKVSLQDQIFQKQELNNTLEELSLKGISSFFDQKYLNGYESSAFGEIDVQVVQLKEPGFPRQKNSIFSKEVEENILQ